MTIIEAYKAALPEGKIRSKSNPHQFFLVKKEGIYSPINYGDGSTGFSGLCLLVETWLTKTDFEVIPSILKTRLHEGLKLKSDNRIYTVKRVSPHELKIFQEGCNNRASDFNCMGKTLGDFILSSSRSGDYANLEIVQ